LGIPATFRPPVQPEGFEMIDFPEIPPCDTPPLIVLTQHRLGGSGKSLCGQLLVDAAYRSGLDLKLFENDDQPFYDPYGEVCHIKMPATETVVHNSRADVSAHVSLDRALIAAGPNDCLIYDCSAASINRHTYVFDELDFALRLAAMERYCMVAIPVSARPDLAREALLGFEIWRDLLPFPNRIVPMINQRDGDVHDLPPGHDLHTLIKLASDGVFVIPRTTMAVINDWRRSNMRLCDLADTRDILGTAAMAKKIGQDPTIMQMMRRAAGRLLTESDNQMVRLGFLPGL
jgi:hypothetical protein